MGEVFRFLMVHLNHRKNGHNLEELPTTRETWVRSLGWEDLLEKEMATHSSKKKKRKKRWEYQTALLAS